MRSIVFPIIAFMALAALPASAQTIANPFGQDAPAFEEAEAPATTNGDVAEILRQSRSGYSGVCGCPEDTDKAGRACGKRSAYHKSGGAALLCYASDIR